MIAVIVNRLATKNVVGDYSSRLFIVCESGTYHNFNSSKDESVFYNIQAWFGKMGAVFRRYSVPISTTGVGAAVVVYFYTQTLSVHFRQYQSLMGHYKDGVMLPIESETQQLIDKVLCFLFALHCDGSFMWFSCSHTVAKYCACSASLC